MAWPSTEKLNPPSKSFLPNKLIDIIATYVSTGYEIKAGKFKMPFRF
jgi:hypothetical protein